MSRDEVPGEVDIADLDRMFASIPAGPYSADARGEGWEVRAIDSDPTNSHHWPYRLCASIAGQKAGCDPAVFGFIAGVINAWPQISARAARTPSTDQRAREDERKRIISHIREVSKRFEPKSASQNNYRALADMLERGEPLAMLPADRQRDRDSKTGGA